MVEPPTEAESVLLPKVRFSRPDMNTCRTTRGCHLQFREMMKGDLSDDRLNDDIYLLRWLRGKPCPDHILVTLSIIRYGFIYIVLHVAREFDLDKAATMLRTVT